MNTEAHKNRVFVLGAGFSLPAGMPDARQLTDLIIDADYLLDNQEFKLWMDSFKKRVACLERDATKGTFALNVEQLFDFAHFDRELWLMSQHECAGGRNDGETPASKAESISAWLDNMEMGLVKVLLEEQEKAEHAVLDPFVKELRHGDTVLTFNYDTLLEERLVAASKTWSHGFKTEDPCDVPVLKLHGSLDWWLSHRDEPLDGKMLFDKANVNADWEHLTPAEKLEAAWEDSRCLKRVRDLEESNNLNEKYTGCGSINTPHPGLGGLGTHKPLHRLVGSGEVWRNALTALQQADEIIVVGWSCSPYDTMARFHFSASIRMREQAPSRTIVVDPNVDAIGDNLEPVFGELEPVDEESQCVDWGRLLR